MHPRDRRYNGRLGVLVCNATAGRGVHADSVWPGGAYAVECGICGHDVVKCGSCAQWALLKTARQGRGEVDAHDTWAFTGAGWRCRKCNKKHAQTGGRNYYSHVAPPLRRARPRRMGSGSVSGGGGDLPGFVVPDSSSGSSAAPRRERPRRKRPRRVTTDSSSGSPAAPRRKRPRRGRPRRIADSSSGSGPLVPAWTTAVARGGRVTITIH